MWSVIILLYLGAVKHTVFSYPASPVDVVFSSVNLRNVLHWLPGNDTAPNTHFIVQYAIYGLTVKGSRGGRHLYWRTVSQCRDTVRRWCDLTNETQDLDEAYYARVRAVGKRAASKWAVTKRFEPKSDTSFGPPLVSVVMKNKSAIISLKGPMRHPPDSHTSEVPMAELYPMMMYELSVNNTRLNQTRHFPVDSSLYTYRLMNYDTEYCFSAKTNFLSMPATCQPSAWHCITTPQDPEIVQLHRVVMGIVVPTVCMCMLAVAGYLLCRSLRGEGQKKPHILELTESHRPPQTFSPEVTKVILITPIIISKPPPQLPSVSLPIHFPSYAPQNPGMLPEPWRNESVEYGFVEEQRDEGESGGGGGKGDHSDSGDARARDERKERVGENDCSTTADSSLTNSYLPQKTQHMHTPTHARTETVTFVQADTQVQTVLLTQNQASKALEGRVEEEMEEEKDDRECSGLRFNRDPHTGLFHIPLLPQTLKGVIDGRVEEGKGTEEAPLLSPYALQHAEDAPTPHTGQWEHISDDYGILSLASDQEEEGTNCVNWDPETRKLVWSGREEEEEMRLGSVLMGQEAGSERGMERGRIMRWEADDDILTNWKLVIPMDQ